MATNKLIDLSRLSRFWDKVKAYVDTNDNAIVNKIYPVGSIYMSVTDSTAAAVQARFGGTWERISEGKALFGYSTTDSAFQTIGSGGGSKSINLQHKHTVDKHTHYMEAYTSGNSGNTGDCTLTINQVPAHSHTVGTRSPGYGQAWKANGASSVASGSNFTAVGRGGDAAWYTETDSKGGGKAHSHSLNNHSHKIEAYTNTSNPSTDNQLSTAQSILNPYITVYMYKRTA